MTDDRTDPPDDELARRLRSGFDSLTRAAGQPSPLPDIPQGPNSNAAGEPARRLLVAAAIVLVALVGTAVVAAVAGRGGAKQRLQAGEGTSTSAAPTSSTWPEPTDRKTPPPAAAGRLLCPPALLDLSALAATPVLMAPKGPRADDPTAWPYELTWQQDGRTVTLSYPYRTAMSMDAPMAAAFHLRDGRNGFIGRGANPSGSVQENAKTGPLGCEGFSLSVKSLDEDDVDGAHQVFIAAAEAVHVHAPPGTTKVPNVVGMARVDAQDALARSGLIPTQPWAFTRFAAQPVTAQAPAAGADAAIGTTIALTLATPPTTTSPPPPPIVEVDALPIPTDPLECPMSRLQVDDEFRSQPKVHSQTTIEWLQDGDFGGYEVLLSWPNLNYSSAGHGSRALTVGGRPALMHDGGDGQDLVYDTGLPGACRYLEIGVYGGPSIPEREHRATLLASGKVTFAPPPSGAPPRVTGLTVAAAADRLARAGFIPDWGEDRALGDQPSAVPTAIVTRQSLTAPGVVKLTT